MGKAKRKPSANGNGHWRNRIIGSEMVAASQLLANPSNWRIHPKAQQDALGGALEQIGWIQDVIVNQQTGHLIDGHLRVTLALRQGDETPVPVKYVDLSEAEEKLALATIDPLSAMAVADKEQLDALLREVNTDSVALQAMLADVAKEAGLYPPQNKDAEPQIDRAEELRVKWGVRSGDLWQLGEHRLVCGDCTDAAVVGRVMGGELATLVVTDPPYGVDYSAKQEWLQSVGKADRLTKPIENDSGTKANIQDTWKRAFAQMATIMCAGAVVYCFMPQGGDQMMMMMMMMGAGIEPRHELIWLKDQQVFGRTDYAYKHEPILYAWKDGAHKFYGQAQTQASVIEIDRPRASKLHPTMKPVELVEVLVGNSSAVGEPVYDPFLGSGTTLIACENLGRKCRAVEISPGYCAVTLERYLTATGKTPILI